MRVCALLLASVILGGCGHGGASTNTKPPRTTVSTPDAPQAIGPYSQAVDVGDFVFVSGQLAIDPATQAVAGDVRAQTDRVLTHVRAVLRAAGLTMANVVKTTVFMTDLADFAAMNEVYATYFPTSPPARATIQVVALPKGAKVEIEAIARR